MTLQEMFETLQNFLQEVYPGGVQLWILERGVQAKSARIHLKSLSDFKAFFHISREKEVCFQPYHFEVLYADDPDPEKLSEIPCAYWKVHTSMGKCQIHIPIPHAIQKAYTTPTLRSLLQRCICEFLKTESISGWRAFRKLPYTQNAKYSPPVIMTVELIKKGENESENIDNFLKLLEMLTPLWKNYYDTYCQTTQETIPDTERKRIATARLKSWIDFYTGDESQADIKYAVYLFSRGLSYQEVENALLRESRDIHYRKKGHLATYLKITLQKAMEYSKATFKPPTTPKT